MNSSGRLVGAWMAILLAAVPLSAAAHHSMSEFDRAVFTEVEGTISRVAWKNPHILMEVTGAEKNGAKVVWTLEGAAVSAVARRGVSGDQFKVGDKVKVAGNPSTRRDNYMQVHHIMVASGAELLVGNVRTPRWTDKPVGAVALTDANKPVNMGDTLFRVWSQGTPAWFFAGPRAGYQLNAAAAAKVAKWDDIADNPLSRCIGPGMPGAMGNPYPMEFKQVGEDIELRLEEFDAVRKIHMGAGAARAAATAPLSPMGYSVGRWEGKTLVVDTTRINWNYFDRAGAPQTPNVKINERFTVAPDGSQLKYLMTVDEPATLVKPFVWDSYFVWKPGEKINRYDCSNESWASPEKTLRK